MHQELTFDVFVLDYYCRPHQKHRQVHDKHPVQGGRHDGRPHGRQAVGGHRGEGGWDIGFSLNLLTPKNSEPVLQFKDSA